MAKYIGIYTEVFKRKYVIEANSEEEAQEKMEFAAENVNGLLDAIADFDHWEKDASRYAKYYRSIGYNARILTYDELDKLEEREKVERRLII